MESVMNFLADYYVWFFVAALVLCFALIGFIIESKKKQKNEFKGESIEENEATNIENTIPVEPVIQNAPVEENVINASQEMATPSNVEPVANNTTFDAMSDDTMEINDIPLAVEPEKEQSSIEYYSGPIDMPTPAPMPAPEVVEDTNYSSNTINNNINNNPFDGSVSYVEESKSTDMNSLFNDTNVSEEKKEELEPFNIFDNRE